MNNTKTYVYFKVWKEYFAIEVAHVVEVLQLPEIIKVPTTPDFLRGVTNFRGDIIPVIDLRKKFKLPPQDENERKYIVVINYESETYKEKVGLVVDQILDVVTIEKYDINQFPELGSRYNAEFIYGIIKVKDLFILVLNLEKILTAAEVEILKEMSSENDLNTKVNGIN